jgi:hypothetical protein
VLKRLLPCLLVLTLVCFAHRAQAGKVLNDQGIAEVFGHHIWSEVLSRAVDSEGRVDWISLRGRPLRLNQYLKQLEAGSPDTVPRLFPTVNHQLAYWINAHNAIAMRLVLDAYPVTHLEQIENFRQVQRYRLGGRLYSLEQIRTLLKQRYPLKPLAVTALTDYAVSSPVPMNTAFQPLMLDAQLKDNLRRYLEDPENAWIPADCSPARLGALLGENEKALLAALRLENNEAELTMLDFLKPYLPPQERTNAWKACKRTILYAPVNPKLRMSGEPAAFIP